MQVNEMQAAAPLAPPAPKKKKVSIQERKERWIAFLFILPPVGFHSAAYVCPKGP